MNLISIEVQHWSAAGNRFVIVDNRTKTIESPSVRLVTKLCQRENLPPAEGLLLLQELDASRSSCRYDFYNPDGSTGVMCGNGARCAVRHAFSLDQWGENDVQLILNDRFYTAKIIEPDRVALRLPLYEELRLIDDWTYVDVGSKHVVLDAQRFVSSLEEFHQLNLVNFARQRLDFYRNQLEISSLNLNMAFFVPQTGLIHLRTYENGVFDETQACGTGAVSTAVAFWTRNLVQSTTISCLPVSQRPLTICFDLDNEGKKIVGIVLEGDGRKDAESSFVSL